jgi:hypothetical protein
MRTRVEQMAACLVVAGCSTEPVTGPSPGVQTCFLIGCESSFTITYATSRAGSYTVKLADGTWSEIFPCPSSDGMLTLDGGGFYRYECDPTSFVLFWPGGDPSDAGVSTISFEVTIAGVDGGVTAPPTTVVGTLGSPYDPNGPQCGPTCVAFEGSL